MKPSLTMRTHKYQSFGRCIYCLEPASGLTEEHIVPKALDGTLIILGAACEPCRKISNEDYENLALQADLYVPRLQLELVGRRRESKRRKEKKLPPVFIGDGTTASRDEFDVELELCHYPPIFNLLHFETAGKLIGVDRTDVLESVRIVFVNLGIERTLAQSSVTMQSKSDPFAFGKTLAKIAYCYAVAEKGFEGFDGDGIRDLLLGKRDDVFNFVGSAPIDSKGTRDHLHRLSIQQRGDWLTVHVHLFASCGIPFYEVVVGRHRT